MLTPGAYNALFTMHGTTMIFLVVMPVLLGFANYFVPLQIGARDMAFPQLNALSFWLLCFGGLVLHFSFLAGTPPDTGWFNYAPLSRAAVRDRPRRRLLDLGAAGHQRRHDHDRRQPARHGRQAARARA